MRLLPESLQRGQQYSAYSHENRGGLKSLAPDTFHSDLIAKFAKELTCVHHRLLVKLQPLEHR